MGYNLSHGDQSIIREALDNLEDQLKYLFKHGSHIDKEHFCKVFDIIQARRSLNNYEA